MARPQLHPRSGTYWFRKRVPADLIAVVGKREEYFSLHTRDPDEAKRRFADELAKVEQRWASLRAGPRTLTEREAHDLAAPVHDEWLAEFRDYPSRQSFWKTAIGGQLWTTTVGERATGGDLITHDPTLVAKVRLQLWCQRKADALIEARGLVVDEAGRQELTRAVGAAIQRASVTLESMARGETAEGAAQASTTAVGQPTAPMPLKGEPLRFSDLFDAWAAEAKPRARTVYEWRRLFTKLEQKVGHDDAKRLTPEDIIGWKDSLVADGLSAKTIRGSHLAAVGTVLRWAAGHP